MLVAKRQIRLQSSAGFEIAAEGASGFANGKARTGPVGPGRGDAAIILGKKDLSRDG